MQSVKAMTFAAVLALAAEQAQATKCYALAFGSGGESSAYTAGALKGLVSHYGAAATSYTAVSGVSGGAINAALLGKYAKGKELDGANRMITFWEHASTNHLWKDWLGGISQGLLFKGGLYNTAPLTTFLKGELSDVVSFQRAVFTGITDVLNGAYVDYNNNTLISHLADVAFASLSFAGVFPPAEVLGGSYFDGGVVWGIDIFSAVNECLKTHSQANTVVDVLLTSAKNLKKVDASNYLSINMLWRYLEISRYYGNMDGLLRAQFAYPDVTFRSIVSPTKDLPSSTIPLVSVFSLFIRKSLLKSCLELHQDSG